MMLSSPWSLLVASIACINAVASQSHFALTGVKTGVDSTTGYRPPRRDILDLINDLPQFSLYVQAMQMMMETSETSLTSFFQIAGIHGRPFISWDNINPTTPAAGIRVGYCSHGSILFGIWHRPYLALVEQVMADHAQTIAKTYNSAVYTKAADQLRFPYWDWAAIPQRFPDIMSAPTVQINSSTGPKAVPNPLYRYKFRSVPEPESWFPSSDGYPAQLPLTLRWPDAQNISYDSNINSQLAIHGSSLTAQVWSVFAKTTDFNIMSTSGNSKGNSFEDPHGTVHYLVGGKGQMGNLSYASFDPSFWLHHANIDRQVAMWQAIYPDNWMYPANSSGGTWTIYPNTVVNEATPLTPFTSGDGKTLYTSITARYTKYFGYSYPDVQDWLPRTPAQLAANVTQRVNKLYNPTLALIKTSSTSVKVAGVALAAGADEKQWSVTVAVPNAAVGEGFSVDLSVGNVAIGKMVVVSAPPKEEIDAGANKITNAEFSLTHSLAGVAGDVQSVTDYLKKNLKWKVLRTDDESVVPLNEVVGLKVTVQDETVTPAADDSMFPIWGTKTLHLDVTAQPPV